MEREGEKKTREVERGGGEGSGVEAPDREKEGQRRWKEGEQQKEGTRKRRERELEGRGLRKNK